MKKILPVILSLAFAPAAFAWFGGPWGDAEGGYTTPQGVHFASFTGKNLTGVAQINQDSLSTGGSFIAFIEGQIVAGNSYATFNSSARTVTGVFEGSQPIILITRIPITGGIQAPIPPEVGGIPVVEGAALQVIRIPGAAGGFFDARIKQTKLQYSWQGSGGFTLTQTGEDGSVSTDIPFTITGVRTALTVPTRVGDGFFNRSGTTSPLAAE